MKTNNGKIRLEAKKISKTFTLHNRGGIQVTGFIDVSFTVCNGEFLVLSGPSGVGKSSVLKLLYRTYTPGDGSIYFHRENGDVINISSCSESDVLQLRKREIGFVTQFLKILPRVTALDFVAAPLIELGTDENQAYDRAVDLLHYLGIREELFDLSPLTFSGGEQQRVNIAHGVIAPKQLILFDEPTASLDEESSNKVLSLLENLKQEGIAMIGIFHDRDKMERIGDREYQFSEV